MVTTASSANCPRCGAAVDPALAGGVCPACLLRAVALGTGADSLPSVPWVPPAVSELAAAFPQLEIVELIGHGGMGAVYKARQKSLGRWVALKILAPQHASKADFAERFSREAKVLAEVNHPHIVTVHDFGQAGEFYFLLMEFVDGVSLRQAMRAGRFTPEQALSIVPPICEALQFAHEHGIVHRDIKPENLLLDKEGRVKIADFGIARMMRSAEGEAVSGSTLTPSPSPGGRGEPESEIDLTQEAILGTPRYMAPEQRDRPASVDHRADIYSLGVVLYEMLTGELPGPSWQPPSRHSAADVRLDQIVQRALEQNPDLRYQSATELRTQIETTVSKLEPGLAGQLLRASDQSPATGDRRDTVLDGMFRREQPHWLSRYLQTDLGRRLFMFGCIGFLGTAGWFHPSLGPLTGFFVLFGLFGLATLVEIRHRRNLTDATAPSFTPEPSQYLGLRSDWARRFMALSSLGFLSSLAVLPGMQRMQGFSGFFGFIGVATMAEFWNRRGDKHQKNWKFFTGLLVAIAIYLGVSLFIIPEFKTHADVVMRNPALEGSYFTFDHEVVCPPGWNVWVSLVSHQGSEVERFQAQLTGMGHARLPVGLMTHQGGDSLPTLPPKVEAYRLAPRHGAGWTLYHNSRNGSGNVTLMMVPVGESPASQDRVPYKTIKPPSRPQSAPFAASYEQGKIEIVRITPHPSDGQIQWMPNGLPCTEQFLPDRDGRSSASDRVIKEITVRVLSNTRDPSWPVLRFPEKSGFGGMGASYHYRSREGQRVRFMIQTIACPPEAREMTVEVGVADGDWKTEISFEPASYPNQREYSRSTHGSSGGDWQGAVQITDAVGDKLPVSFSYTDRADAETRLVYELADGQLVPMPGTSGLGDSRTGLMTIPVKEFEQIKQFHVQSRRYQWAEFRNVSLELGHKTEVEIQDAY